LARAAFIGTAKDQHASDWAIEIDAQAGPGLIFKIGNRSTQGCRVAGGFGKALGRGQTGRQARAAQGGKITVG
jgi:hypothetical protein